MKERGILMCGRFSQYWSLEQLDAMWPVDWHVAELPPRYNVAPGSAILTIVCDSQDRAIGGLMTWGMRMSKTVLINARAETVEERSTFRPLFYAGRCVVPMNGYFEWHQQSRQPYYMTRDGEDANGWALGLYQKGAGGAQVVIMTRPATALLAGIHPRMPLVVGKSDAQAWLSRQTPAYRSILNRLLGEETPMRVIPVSHRVNRASQDGPDLIQPMRQDAPEIL